MPRRHEDHQPVDLAPFYSLKLVGNTPVVLGRDIIAIRVFSERYQAVGCRFPPDLGPQYHFERWRLPRGRQVLR